jgi:L-asparaginase
MSHILLLDAGGTISSRAGRDGALTAGLAADRLADLVPRDMARVSVRQVYSGLSEEMRLGDMAGIVAAVVAAQADPDVDGVVVAHGTDVMEEVAFLTDLMIDVRKPVVFTGAQRAAGQARFDGPRNLRDAVRAAASPALEGLGVVVAFAGRLIPARQAFKAHTSALRAFRARDDREGKISGWAILPPAVSSRRAPLPLITPAAGVELIGLGGGSSGALIGAAAGLGLKGLVLCALGRGNAGAAVTAAVEAAVTEGVVVVVASRCPEGRSAPDYATGLALQRAGAIFSGDLGASQARMLLSTLLAIHGSGDSAATAFRAWIDQPPGI